MTDTTKTKADFEKIIARAKAGIERLERPKITSLEHGAVYEVSGQKLIYTLGHDIKTRFFLVNNFCTGIQYGDDFETDEAAIKWMYREDRVVGPKLLATKKQVVAKFA